MAHLSAATKIWVASSIPAAALLHCACIHSATERPEEVESFRAVNTSTCGRGAVARWSLVALILREEGSRRHLSSSLHMCLLCSGCALWVCLDGILECCVYSRMTLACLSSDNWQLWLTSVMMILDRNHTKLPTLSPSTLSVCAGRERKKKRLRQQKP